MLDPYVLPYSVELVIDRLMWSHLKRGAFGEGPVSHRLDCWHYESN